MFLSFSVSLSLYLFRVLFTWAAASTAEVSERSAPASAALKVAAMRDSMNAAT